jgi:hypothetical protein
MKPICFMVMPFRRKAVTHAAEGAPAEVDFDRLWDAAFRPAIEEIGFLPVRADLEPGSVIIKDMLNRLRHADLVLADISLPNSNVYYEIGIRHVAQETSCILIAANWFKPMFDVKQFRTLPYPLEDGEVPDAEAAVIKDLLVHDLPGLSEARSPYHVLVDEDLATAFAEEAEQISRFQAELAAVRLMPAGAGRAGRVAELVAKHSDDATFLPEVAVELLYLVRDASDWSAVREFVEALPEAARRTETVQEQYLLALSELGEHETAIAGLQELNGRLGATPERCGIIGGRYKRLYREARERRIEAGEESPAVDERRYLKEAIKHYEQGMQLDLNEYYCACNLPGLLRARGRKGDRKRADAIETLVVSACRRAEERGSQDPWLPDTLFGTAFRRGDVTALEDIVEDVETGRRWRLGSTLRDAEDWIAQAPEDSRVELTGILERLRAAHGR